MEVKWMEIAPDTAQEWLRKSDGNPRWKDKKKIVDNVRVNKIIGDIQSGNWNPGNNSIAFDVNGILVDGHHRLTAIKKAGTPVWSIVVFGIEQPGLQHIDENRTRSVSQRTSLDTRIIGAVNCHFWMRDSLTRSSETSENILKFVDQHPCIYTALNISQAGGHHPIGKRSPIIHAIMCAIEFGVDEGTLDRFMRSVNSGFVDNRSESAAVVLRNMILDSKSKTRFTSVQLDRAAQTAISDYVDRRERKKAYHSCARVYFDLLAKMGRQGYIREDPNAQ